MIDVEKQVAYWKAGAEEDWAVALELLEPERTRYGLFLAYLAIETVLRSLVARKTQDICPRSHALVLLAQMAGLALSETQADTLVDINFFNVEYIRGRYPDRWMIPPSLPQARALLSRAEDMFRWLISLL